MGKLLTATLADIKQKGIHFQPELAETRKNQLTAMLNFLQMMKKDIESLKSQQSIVDKTISKIMHDLEQENFNASEGFKVAKTLQDLRRERRRIKSELIAVARVNEQAKFNFYKLEGSCVSAICELNSYEVYVGISGNGTTVTVPIDDLDKITVDN